MAEEETGNDIEDRENEDFGFDGFEETGDMDYYKEDLEGIMNGENSSSSGENKRYDYGIMFDTDEVEEYDPNKVYKQVHKNCSAYNLFIKDRVENPNLVFKEVLLKDKETEHQDNNG